MLINELNNNLLTFTAPNYYAVGASVCARMRQIGQIGPRASLEVDKRETCTHAARDCNNQLTANHFEYWPN